MSIEEKLNIIIADLSTIKKKINDMKGNKDESEEDFVDTQQICEKFKLTKEAVKKYRQRNIIPYYKMNGKILFKISEVVNGLNYRHNGSNGSK